MFVALLQHIGVSLVAVHRDAAALAGSLPGMMEDVSGLIVVLVAGGLKDEIVREMRAVVSHVKTRDECIRLRAGAAVAEPENAELFQLVR